MPVMTWEKLLRRIEDGRGSGHGDAYQPWLWIHRKNASKRGNQATAPLPGYRRTSHFLAVIEWHTALLCLFLGAQDVREQFPMWPMPHFHPLAGVPEGTGCGYPSLVRGLMDIANEAEIPHGFEAGSGGVPYVATLDLGVTLRSDEGPRFAGISLKPHDEILAAEPADRMLERLKLEELYLHEFRAHYKIVDRSVLGAHTGANLEIFASAIRLPRHLLLRTRLEDFCQRLMEVAEHTNISEGIRRAGSEMRLSPIDANFLWRYGGWSRRIDVDITQPMELGQPLRRGGRPILDRLKKELFGEA